MHNRLLIASLIVTASISFAADPRDVEAENLSSVVADDKEAVKYPKGKRRYREEVHGCNGLAMVPQEYQPTPGRIWSSRGSPKPSRHSSFR